VIAGTFEQLDFAAEELTTDSYNAIIAAGVLEHIHKPVAGIATTQTAASPGWGIYVSLPNVHNLNVLSALASGEWRYLGAGILDITHIGFFTLAQASEMLSQTGWIIGEARVNPDPSLAVLFEGKNLDEINTISIGKLRLESLDQMDVAGLLAVQFFIRAEPAPQNHSQ